jgi:hypothetical protein
LDDPRYKRLASRLKHIEGLYEELARIATSRTNAKWLVELHRRNIPAMRRTSRISPRRCGDFRKWWYFLVSLSGSVSNSRN